MKRLNPVDIRIDTCMDADDYGQRLVDCVRTMSVSNDVINLVKFKLGDNIKLQDFTYIAENVSRDFKTSGITNCIFVPIKKGFIEDVLIDHIEVIEDELDNRAD